MTNLLMEVVRKVSELPADRQEDAAQVLLTMLENDVSPYCLSHEQLHEVDLAIADADAGRFAPDEEIEEVLYRSWA